MDLQVPIPIRVRIYRKNVKIFIKTNYTTFKKIELTKEEIENG